MTITIRALVRASFVVALAPLAPTSTLAVADYLEVRADAAIYAKPTKSSKVQITIKVDDGKEPQYLQLIDDRQTSGYYHVSIPGNGEGWIYRSYIRRHRGDPPLPSDAAGTPTASE